MTSKFLTKFTNFSSQMG